MCHVTYPRYTLRALREQIWSENLSRGWDATMPMGFVERIIYIKLPDLITHI